MLVHNFHLWTVDQKNIIQIVERWCINKIIRQNIQKLLLSAVFWLITSKYPYTRAPNYDSITSKTNVNWLLNK